METAQLEAMTARLATEIVRVVQEIVHHVTEIDPLVAVAVSNATVSVRGDSVTAHLVGRLDLNVPAVPAKAETERNALSGRPA